MRRLTHLRAPPLVGEDSLRQAVRADFAAASGWKVVAVAALVAWMAFQWGFGNDILLPSIAATAFDAVDNGETWASGFAAVAAAGISAFVFWALTQLLDAVIVLSGLKLVPAITSRLSRFLVKKGWVTPYDEMRWSTRWIIAYVSGVSLLCLVDVFATGTQGVKHRRRMIASATALSAGTVGAVAAMVATAAMVARRIPATRSGAEIFVRFAKTPFTWIALFLVITLVGHLIKSDDADASQPAPRAEGEFAS